MWKSMEKFGEKTSYVRIFNLVPIFFINHFYNTLIFINKFNIFESQATNLTANSTYFDNIIGSESE